MPTRPPLESLGDADSRFTPVLGLTVHHKNWTPSASTPRPECMLLVHGFGASLFSFSAAAESLSALGWHASALDLPGFGLTERPGLARLARYAPPFAGQLLLRLPLAVLSPRVLVGHSMGCLSAVEAAFASSSDQVSALVLVAPPIVPVPSTCVGRAAAAAARSASMLFAPGFLLFSLALAPALAVALRRLVAPRAFWESGLAQARAGRTAGVPDSVVDGYRRPMGAPGWENGLLNFARCMLLYRAVNGDRLLRALAAVAERGVPVLIVHGSHDRLVPISNSRALKRALPGIQMRVMDGTGHVPHEERPDEFAEVVGQFLEEAETGADGRGEMATG